MGRPNRSRATVICRQQDKVLLVRKPEAKWSLPGGTIEADEQPLEAALRELAEETGLASDSLRFVALHRFAARAHHVFLASIPDSQAARAQNEIADCRWFSLEDLQHSTVVKKPSRELLRLYGHVSPARTLDASA